MQANRRTEASGKALSIPRDSRSPRRRDDLEPGLSNHPDPVLAGDPRQNVRGGRILLAAVIQRAVRLQVPHRSDGSEAGDLERDQRLEIRNGHGRLGAPEACAVVIAGMRPHFDPKLETPQCRRNGDRDGAGVHTAPDARAVDARKDRLIVAGAFAQVRVQVQSWSVSPCRSRTAWSSIGMTASSDSVAPLTLPGTLMISARPRTPASPRDSAAIGVFAAPASLIVSARPGTSKSSDDHVGSQVDRVNDRVSDAPQIVRHYLRPRDLELSLDEDARQRRPALILHLPGRCAIADRDDVRTTHFLVVRFHVPDLPPDFSSSRTFSR